MAKFTTYQPNSVKLPSDLQQKYGKNFPLFDVARQVSCAGNVDYALLHDVFRTPDGTKILFIDTWSLRQDIGALQEMLPLEVYYQDHKLHYQRVCIDKDSCFGVFQIELSNAAQRAESIKLQFKWRTFATTISVAKNPYADAKKVDFTLQTIQKNNHLLWIADWCRYYHREHGVDRIVLYDNGSDDFVALADCLQNIPDDIDIILISTLFDYNRLNEVQMVGLNHCPLLFGDSSRYYLNFDVDEYLVVEGGDNLLQIVRCASKTIATFMVESIRVVFYRPNNLDSKIPRANDFVYESIESIEAPKTINKYGEFELLGVHSTTPKTWVKARCARVFLHKAQKVFRLLKMNYLVAMVDNIARISWQPNLHCKHYKGLNTGWKYQWTATTHKNDNWILDDSVARKFAQHKIAQDK